MEPDGATASSNWKSIVDRDEQLVVFFQVDYVQSTPRLSKCIRVQRVRSDDFQLLLVPSVFFNNRADHSIVLNTLGRTYLEKFDDISTLLNALDGGESPELADGYSHFPDGEQDETEALYDDEFVPFSEINSEEEFSSSDFVIVGVLHPADFHQSSEEIKLAKAVEPNAEMDERISPSRTTSKTDNFASRFGSTMIFNSLPPARRRSYLHSSKTRLSTRWSREETVD